MAPNKGITVAEFADPTEQLLQSKSPLELWVTDCFSLSTTRNNIWTPSWIESLRTGLREADSKLIKQGYKLLTKQFNSQLQQQYPTDEDTQNNWVSALLLLLLAMYVYRKTTTECYRDQIELKAKPWKEHTLQVMRTVPNKEVYLNQLSQLVCEAIDKKQPIDRTVDRALLKIHYHTLDTYFHQFSNELSHSTKEGCPPPYEGFSAYKRYKQMIGMLQPYITRLSNLPLKEKKYLPNLLLEQLTELIETTSTLDLSPSWTERLKQWIKWCFSQLTSLYESSTPSAVETPPSLAALLSISQRLRKVAKKSAKKSVWNKKSPSPELIRERCWLYFSLHEQLIAQWEDKWEGNEAYALEYRLTALALFESFMSTFDWPSKFKKGILGENPLTSYRSAQFNLEQSMATSSWRTRLKKGILQGNPLTSYQSAKPATPVEHWEPLLDTALNKLAGDFFSSDWFGSVLSERFLPWLLSRQEPCLMTKIKDYARTEEREFQEDEISAFDKRVLYRFVQEIHKDFCANLNQITQMILRVWFQEIGFIVSHADLEAVLSKSGRWLYHKNQQRLPTREEGAIPSIAFLMLQAIERLGAGLYFFPPLQRRWSVYQEALAAHSGSSLEFLHQHHTKITAILAKLLLIFHLDHKSEAYRNDPTLKDWAQEYLPDIKKLKCKLSEFRSLDSKELQSYPLRKRMWIETETNVFLPRLKRIVLDCMHCHVGNERWIVNALTLSPDELQQQYSQYICEYVSTIKQIDAQMTEIRGRGKEERKEKEAAQAREEQERNEKEAAQAEVERLNALLAALQPAVVEEPQAQPQPAVAEEPQVQPQPAAAEEPQAQSQSTAVKDSIQRGVSETNSIHEEPELIEAKAQVNEQRSLAGSRETLFHHVPTAPQASTTTAQDTEIAGTSNSVFPNR